MCSCPLETQVGDRYKGKLYRLHVGRSFTVFYQICEEEVRVKILEIMTIDKAHKLYKHFKV